MATGKYQKQNRHRGLIPLLIVLAVLIVGAVLVLDRWDICQISSDPSQTSTVPSTADTVPTTTPPQTQPPIVIPTAPLETTEPTEPPITTDPYVVSTASIGVTGDILIHSPIYNSAHQGGGVYDFSGMFEFVADYFQQYDFMVANLEVPLAGADVGYSGYPRFNCPDAIVDALGQAGVDMLLTANNHTYDRGHNGFIRTQEVITDKGLQYLGTRLDEETPIYTIQDINGIQVGMVCYTYETGNTGDGRKTLNGNPVNRDDCNLISSFHLKHLDRFYAEVEDTLDAMRYDGAEVTMVYIHWGDEYQLKQNNTQRIIAENLCELGVDVIVGGHPHVIQPFEILTSSTGHETYCIYSVGNAISNQRKGLISAAPKGHTEDGMIFGVTFTKWNDGNVVISQITVLPLWVNRNSNNANGSYYAIIPLDPNVEDWTTLGVNGNLSQLKDSYNRTMAIVGEGMMACWKRLGMIHQPIAVE